MSHMPFWYDKEPDDQNYVKTIAIRCSNFGKETGLFMNNMNTNYKDIITSFFFEYIVTPCWYVTDN